MIYLDHNASSPLKPAVCAAMMEAMGRAGNASSTHGCGRTARKHIEEARARVAALVGAKPSEVIFTSGGTESNNMALRRLGETFPTLVSAVEHASVHAATPQATVLPVNRDGTLDMKAAEKLCRKAPPSIMAVQWVNNETGVIQDMDAVAYLAKAHGHFLHIDAVQAAGRVPMDFAALGANSLALSAHKIGGPQGVGALIVAEGCEGTPLLRGGGQERNRRAGTENSAGIVGFGVAAQLAADDLLSVPQWRRWRDDLQQRMTGIAGDDLVVIGANAERVANTLCVALPGLSSETQVIALDLAGIAVGAGAACSSGKVKASPVLQAMGYNRHVAGSALRVSLGWNTEAGDLLGCLNAWQSFYRRVRPSATSQSVAA